jgi:hypothetical protein
VFSYLRFWRKNREEEDKVMKDVPGWQTGTWYGEPVYFTTSAGWFDPIDKEVCCLMVHAHSYFYFSISSTATATIIGITIVSLINKEHHCLIGGTNFFRIGFGIM